jgi:hypothetical protein
VPVSLKIFLSCWFVAIAIAWVRTRSPKLLQLLVVSVICLLGFVCVGLAIGIAGRLTPRYDLWLYRVEEQFGAPAWFVSRAVLHTWLYPLLVVVYETLPAILLVTYALNLAADGEPDCVFHAFILNFTAGYLLYWLLPASGPVYAFSGFPAHAPAAPPLKLLDLAAPPNCMPSLHTSTAVLALAFCWRWTAARIGAGIILALTVIATLATGEHYLIDLIVALPYAAFVFAAVHRRYQMAAGYLTAVLGWIATLRFAPAILSPAVFIVATLATVCGSLTLLVNPLPVWSTYSLRKVRGPSTLTSTGSES